MPTPFHDFTTWTCFPFIPTSLYLLPFMFTRLRYDTLYLAYLILTYAWPPKIHKYLPTSSCTSLVCISTKIHSSLCLKLNLNQLLTYPKTLLLSYSSSTLISYLWSDLRNWETEITKGRSVLTEAKSPSSSSKDGFLVLLRHNSDSLLGTLTLYSELRYSDIRTPILGGAPRVFRS
jgi:hypothetical protein